MFFHTFIRSLLCIAIVMATYNPSGHSYWHWVIEGMTVTKAAFGVLLVVTYVFLSWVVLGSLGVKGTVAGLVVAGLSGHQVYRLVGPDQARSVIEMIILTGFAVFLGVGLSWPALMTGLSGQIHKRFLTYAGKKAKKRA